MKFAKLALFSLSILVFATAAFASKQDELDHQALKPWTLAEHMSLLSTAADVNETEPNNVCPGESFTPGDTFHGELVSGDEDWVFFNANAGDAITIGTDEDLGLPTVDTVIELWDDTCGAMLTSNDDGGPGLYSLIDGFEAPYTGQYSLKVRGFLPDRVGNYVLLGNVVVPLGPGFCPIGTYKASKINVNAAIPDFSSTDPQPPLVTPAIKFNDQPGVIVTDVVIDLDMEHTWAGDLIITLEHTSDSGAVTAIDLVQRPGVPETGFGCDGNLVHDPENKYYFGTRPDLNTLGDDVCREEIPGGCYAVAPENPDALTIYRGMAKGDGTWRLIISDNAAGDLGYVYNWSVHLLCESPISVEPKSWGNIKASYR